MSSNEEGYEALDLANSILLALHDTKTDPAIGYAALGCAFQQLHKALGKDKEEWLSTTKEMADLYWEKEHTHNDPQD